MVQVPVVENYMTKLGYGYETCCCGYQWYGCGRSAQYAGMNALLKPSPTTPTLPVRIVKVNLMPDIPGLPESVLVKGFKVPADAEDGRHLVHSPQDLTISIHKRSERLSVERSKSFGTDGSGAGTGSFRGKMSLESVALMLRSGSDDTALVLRVFVLFFLFSLRLLALALRKS
jgi:hypothetical protein